MRSCSTRTSRFAQSRTTSSEEPELVGVASVQNEKFSRDMSGYVRASKDRQMQRSQQLSGPVPDVLVLDVERDDADRVVSQRYVLDPERSPIIERMFDLSDEGHGDSEVARALNREGHRTG